MRFTAEIRRLTVAPVQLVNLGTAAAGVPRIAVHLLDVGRLAQVHQDPAAGRPGIEKEILRRRVLFRRHPAIVQFVQAAAVAIRLAVHQAELGGGARIRLRRGRDALEFETG